MVQATTTEAVVQPSEWEGKHFPTGTAAATFAAIAPTTTLPATDEAAGVGIAPTGRSVHKLAFFGTGSSGQTFDVKIVAWSKIAANNVGEFIPTALAHLTVTLGGATGASGGILGGTGQLMADTVASNYATESINIVSPGDDIPAMVELSHTGAQYIGLYFDMTGATTANAIFMNT